MPSSVMVAPTSACSSSALRAVVLGSVATVVCEAAQRRARLTASRSSPQTSEGSRWRCSASAAREKAESSADSARCPAPGAGEEGTGAVCAGSGITTSMVARARPTGGPGGATRLLGPDRDVRLA